MKLALRSKEQPAPSEGQMWGSEAYPLPGVGEYSWCVQIQGTYPTLAFCFFLFLLFLPFR